MASLRFVYDQISVHVRGLASLGVSSEQYSSLLITIIMSKMPSDIRLEIARKAEREVWKIDELLETIRLEIEAGEISEATKSSERGPQTGYGHKRPEGVKNQNTPTAYSLFASAKDGDQKSGGMPFQSQPGLKVRCAYCNGMHYSASCESVLSVNDQKAILKGAGRCFKCLYRGHNAKDCRGSRNCRHCNGQHHQSICLAHEAKPPVQQREEKSDEGENAESNPGKIVTTAANTSRRHVLLQTARGNAVNTDGSRTIPVTVLFDNGSQCSYVTDSLRSKLGLTPDKNETLHLNTFGDNKYKTQKCQVFTLNFETSNGDICPISALNFPTICTPLGANFYVSDYPYLQDLDLANSPMDERQRIDVLIGSDHYWDFITGEVIPGKNGPVAMSSKFGWVLSGPTNVSVEGNESEILSNLIISGGGKFDDCNENPMKLPPNLNAFGMSKRLKFATKT